MSKPKMVKATIVRGLIAANRVGIKKMDALMKLPSTVDRGRLVAKLLNNWETTTDLTELKIGEFRVHRKKGAGE